MRLGTATQALDLNVDYLQLGHGVGSSGTAGIATRTASTEAAALSRVSQRWQNAAHASLDQGRQLNNMPQKQTRIQVLSF